MTSESTSPGDLAAAVAAALDPDLLRPSAAPYLYVRQRVRMLRQREDLLVKLRPGALFALHLVPASDVTIDIRSNRGLPLLLSDSGRDSRIVHDGLLATAENPEGAVQGYTHLRRDGVIEAVDARWANYRVDGQEDHGIPVRGLDAAIAGALRNLVEVVRDGEPGVEISATLSILDAGHCWFRTDGGWPEEQTLLSNEIVPPATLVGDDIAAAAATMAGYVWNAGGYEAKSLAAAAGSAR